MADEGFCLEELFQSIARSVDEGTKIARDSMLDDIIKEFFVPVTGPSGKAIPDRIRPKMIEIDLPQYDDAGSMVSHTYTVPLYALANHQGISLKTLEIDMDVEFGGLESSDKCSEKKMMTSLCSRRAKKGSSSASVKMVFEGANPCEGAMRINDILVKTLPPGA
jgi:hypothetical protein